MSFRLTTHSIETRCRFAGKTTTFWDSELRGFGLIVREKSATFVLQRDVGARGAKRTKRWTIGRLGVWTPDAARKRAVDLLRDLDRGVDPLEACREEKQKAAASFTLAQALREHLDDMRKQRCSERSIDTMETEVERLFPDWLQRPLVAISGPECRARHTKVTEGNGPYLANRALRHFRAVWNTADRLHELPERCPVRAVVFNPEQACKDRVQWQDLPWWWGTVADVDNPVRRDLQRFLLLTGLRSEDACAVRWEDVDFEAGTLHRPRPKGGESRAFTVPLARWVLDMLEARQEENRAIFPLGDEGWCWPTRTTKDERVQVTRVWSPRVTHYVDGKKRDLLPPPHDLRRTFISAATEAGVDSLAIKVLVNHRMPSGDVTTGYVSLSAEHLRSAAERVVAFLLTRAGVQVPGR
jgi:integrase